MIKLLLVWGNCILKPWPSEKQITQVKDQMNVALLYSSLFGLIWCIYISNFIKRSFSHSKRNPFLFGFINRLIQLDFNIPECLKINEDPAGFVSSYYWAVETIWSIFSTVFSQIPKPHDINTSLYTLKIKAIMAFLYTLCACS